MKNPSAAPFLLLVLVLLSELTCPAAPTQTNSPQNVCVAFAGIGHGVDYVNAAMFTLTNQGTNRVFFGVISLESRSAQGWVTNAAPVTTRQFTGGGARPWWMCLGILAPLGSTALDVALPFTNAVWRLRFKCIEEATGVQGAIHKTKDAVTEVVTGVKTLTMGGREYQVVSPEVTK